MVEIQLESYWNLIEILLDLIGITDPSGKRSEEKKKRTSTHFFLFAYHLGSLHICGFVGFGRYGDIDFFHVFYIFFWYD